MIIRNNTIWSDAFARASLATNCLANLRYLDFVGAQVCLKSALVPTYSSVLLQCVANVRKMQTLVRVSIYVRYAYPQLLYIVYLLFHILSIKV